MTKSLGVLIVLIAVFVLLGVLLPVGMYYTDGWHGTGAAVMLLKTVVLLIWIIVAALVAAIGGIKITASDAAHMEWLGSALVFAGGIVIGILVFIKNVRG